MRCNLGNSSCQKHPNQTSSAHFSLLQRHRCWNTFIFTSNTYHTLECLSLQHTQAAFSTHDFSHCHFGTGSQANPDIQTPLLFLSNTMQLLHLLNLLYGVRHPNGKCLWSLSPEARHSLNNPTDVHATGEAKEHESWQVRMVAEKEHGAPSACCPLWHLAHSQQTHLGPTLHRSPSTGRTMSCATVPACPRGSTVGQAFQSLLYSWKGCTEAKEVDGVKSCPTNVNRNIVIVFNRARLSLHGTCQKIPIPTCIFLFQDEN